MKYSQSFENLIYMCFRRMTSICKKMNSWKNDFHMISTIKLWDEKFVMSWTKHYRSCKGKLGFTCFFTFKISINCVMKMKMINVCLNVFRMHLHWMHSSKRFRQIMHNFKLCIISNYHCLKWKLCKIMQVIICHE